jgi:hypothetical protein
MGAILLRNKNAEAQLQALARNIRPHFGVFFDILNARLNQKNSYNMNCKEYLCGCDTPGTWRRKRRPLPLKDAWSRAQRESLLQ